MPETTLVAEPGLADLGESAGEAPRSLTAWLHRRLRTDDQKVLTFLDDGEAVGTELTGIELDRQVRAIARELQKRNLQGERALLLYPPGLDFVAAFLACLYAGVVAVPAYPPRRRRPVGRLAALAGDCRPAICLSPAAFVKPGLALRQAVPELAEATWLATDRIALDQADAWVHPDPLDHESLAFLQYTSGSTSIPKGVRVTHGNLLHNEAMISQAFQQTRDSVVVGWLPLYHDMGLIGNLLQPLSVGARCVLMAPTAFLQRPIRWLRAISEHRATASGGPNFAYELCLRKIDPADYVGLDLSCWRVAFNGAEPVRASTLERFAEALAPYGFRREAFHPCYGLAEGTLLVSGVEVDRPPRRLRLDRTCLDRHRVQTLEDTDRSPAQRLVSSGRAWSGQEILVVHPETKRVCAEDDVGEIWVRGDSVADGYWDRPMATQETFHARLEDGSGPFLRTGDLGFLHRDAAGRQELFVTGRLKDLIILRGRNLYPQDIEATVESTHSALRPGCGAAFAVDLEGEESLVVAQEVSRHAAEALETLRDAIREAVAMAHEVQPHDVVLLREGTIPKTSSGKIRRRACHNAYLDDRLVLAGSTVRTAPPKPTKSAPKTAPEAGAKTDGEMDAATSTQPSTELIERITGVLRRAAGQLLGVATIDADKSLPAQGLDSLGAVELGHAVQKELGIAPDLDELMAGLSLRQLAVEWSPRLSDRPSHRSQRPAPHRPTSHRPAPHSLAPQTFPLSRGQHALVFIERLATAGGAYNIAAAARVRGELDGAAFEQAVLRLADRHPMLRAVVEDRDGTLHQTITSAPPFIRRVDASGAAESEVVDELRQQAFQSFDLAHGPLLRVELHRRGPKQHLLLLVVHHLVSDFWSISRMIEELGRLYAQETGAGAGPGDPPDRHFSEAVASEASWLESSEGQAAGRYWKSVLNRPIPNLEVPTDRPRPAVMGFAGDSVSFPVAQATTEQARALAKRSGATLFMVLQTAWGAFLHRVCGQSEIWVGSPTAGRHHAELAGVLGYFVNPIVLRQRFATQEGFDQHLDQVRGTALSAFAHQRYPFALLAEELQEERDPSRSPLFQTMLVVHRSPGPAALDLFALGEGSEVAGDAQALPWADLELESLRLPRRPVQFDLTLQFAATSDGALVGSLQFSTDLFDPTSARRFASAFTRLLEQAATAPGTALENLSLFGRGERHQLLQEWNDTHARSHAELFLPAALSTQAERTPNEIALLFADQELTWSQLLTRCHQLAHHLIDLGAGPQTVVGIALERSVDLVVALWAVLETGAAYLPLDPTYPAQRLRNMADDSDASLILTRGSFRSLFRGAFESCQVVTLEGEAEQVARRPTTPLERRIEATWPAYVIYTSGSTGKPKGVVVPHAAVRHFFNAMDHRLGRVSKGDLARRWLAVTSISFDISVLELLYTLTRGYTVVLGSSLGEATQGSLASRLPQQKITFSLMYFSSDVDQDPSERYRLLLEGAKFADREGFEAVWTPERHFHAFGGLFPNPSVISAALATLTQRLQIRAGSVVSPLHHPLRVAEEWSVVDNLSGGRIGIAMASGWQPDDFVLAPDNYRDRKEIVRRNVETLRSLWRGETIALPNGVGQEAEVSILPPPIQPELPLWITAAGSAETFADAGRMRCGVLTHLLGQSLEEVAAKIDAYRQAYLTSGAEGRGHVTLMLHTFVGDDRDRVRETVRSPFTRYLRTSFGLMKSMAAGQDLESMNDEDMRLLLARAFDRYFETSGLFGTPAECLDRVDQLKEIGVDEVACLVDFGVETDTVLASLEDLLKVKAATDLPAESSDRETGADQSIPAEILRRGVTHLQCTPSLARALLADPEANAALAELRVLMVGGEALAPDLAKDLVSRLEKGILLNMYGPTETTIWSSVAQIEAEGPVTLGQPINNTDLRVLDGRGDPVPALVSGELLIGGQGVVQGYHQRPALTAERFAPDPFTATPGLRLYRTGDLVRLRPDGRPEYLGRFDHQIKLRGHRIELGEIEVALQRQSKVREALVMARTDRSGEPQLVAYVVPSVTEKGYLQDPDPKKQQQLFAGKNRYRLPFGVEVAQLTSPQTHAIYREIWEADVYRRHGVHLPDDAVIFDVGANIGLFSLFAHQQARNPRVFAFEPIPTTFEVLAANLQTYCPTAEIFNLGIGAREETVPFTFYPQMAGLSGHLSDQDRETTRSIIRSWLERTTAERDDIKLPTEEELEDLVDNYLVSEIHECRLVPLSAVLRAHSVERIDYLKIDVEGAELEVLRGIAAEDWPKIRQIALEIHSKELLRAATELLERQGFELDADEFIPVADQIDAVYMLYARRSGTREFAASSSPSAAKASSSLTPEGLRQALAAELPGPMVPAHIVQLDSLPLLPNGKVDRGSLPAPNSGSLSGPQVRREPVVAPSGALQQTIANVWRELLGGEEISVTDNFFESGGNSLLLMQAHGKLRAALDREVSLVDLMRHPTVASLAKHLDESDSAARRTRQQQIKNRMSRRRQAFARKPNRSKPKVGRT